jgi:hypothetical protein
MSGTTERGGPPKKSAFFCVFSFLALGCFQVVFAAEALIAPKLGVCGYLEDFAGAVHVLEPERNRLLDADVRTPVPCGSWLSTEEGWVRLRHRDGYRLILGAQGFAEIVDPDLEQVSEKHGEAVVLYRGQLRVVASGDLQPREVRVVTPHARARVKDGQAIVVYAQPAQQTQLIALEESAVLENRFEPEQRARVRPGEASSLNFGASRVTPEPARPVALASLRQKLADLQVEDDAERSRLLASASGRRSRKAAAFAAAGKSKDRSSQQGSELQRDQAMPFSSGSRSPAALKLESEQAPEVAAKASPRLASEYRRHPESTPETARDASREIADDAMAHRQWVGKLTGGARDPDSLLNPGEGGGSPAGFAVSIAPGGPAGKAEAQARSELLRELSRLKNEP